MTDHQHDPVPDTMRRLRDAVRGRVRPTPAGTLRARAARRLRVRRAATVAAAAAAVAAVVLAGSQLGGPAAGPPAPPADRSPTTPAPVPPSPTPTGPPPVPAVTPEPRPEPSPAGPPDDPIAEVDWTTTTVTLPPRDGCPDGPVELHPVSDIVATARGPLEGFPALTIGATNAAYGDLTGDGALEVVVSAACRADEEGDPAHNERLLVVSRAGDGTLTGLAYLGRPGTSSLNWWVEDGALLVDADPWAADPEDAFPAVPGLALGYRWDGADMVDGGPAGAYRPLVPAETGEDGPPVRPGAVATALGCPDREIRFEREAADWGGSAGAAGATFQVPASYQQQFLFDLDNTGLPLLVTALGCTDPDGWTRHGLAVFDRDGDGWQGISVRRPPDGFPGAVPGSWEPEPDGTVRVGWLPESPDAAPRPPEVRYRWTGTALEPLE